MTVSLTNAEVKLLGNGTTTQWPLGFELTDANGLSVSVWDSSGNETVLDLYTDYSVSDIGSELGATITYPLLGAALPDGKFLYVKRTTDLTQQMDGGAEQALNAQQIVAQIDKMAMQIQELKAQLSRTLRMATTAGTEFVATPNLFFGTDSSGRPALLSWSRYAPSGVFLASVRRQLRPPRHSLPQRRASRPTARFRFRTFSRTQ